MKNITQNKTYEILNVTYITFMDVYFKYYLYKLVNDEARLEDSLTAGVKWHLVNTHRQPYSIKYTELYQIIFTKIYKNKYFKFHLHEIPTNAFCKPKQHFSSLAGVRGW